MNNNEDLSLARLRRVEHLLKCLSGEKHYPSVGAVDKDIKEALGLITEEKNEREKSSGSC